jgi:hypothetical protein
MALGDGTHKLPSADTLLIEGSADTVAVLLEERIDNHSLRR